MITNTMLGKSINYFLGDSKFKLYRRAAICSFLQIVFAQTAICQSLRIVDCQGKTRAVRQVPTSEPTEMKVQLNSSEIKSVKIVNAKGEVIDGVIEDGIATFSDVPTDIWVLTTDTPGGFFSNITFNPAPVGLWSDVGNVALVTAGVVGAVVIGGAIEGSSSSSDDGDAGSGGGACVTCNPDQGAPSISPFSSRR
jgi:hypothetical protein